MTSILDKPVMPLVNRIEREIGPVEAEHVSQLFMKAVSAEAGWKNCSRACARLQGERDEALAALRGVLEIADRKHDAFDRARALLRVPCVSPPTDESDASA